MTTAKLQISTDETIFRKSETRIKFMTLISFLSKIQLTLPGDINLYKSFILTPSSMINNLNSLRSHTSIFNNSFPISIIS